MDDYIYLYINVLEPKVFLQWIRQYIMDMEDPVLLRLSGGYPWHFVQLPTINQPIPITQWQVDEVPIDREFGLHVSRLHYWLFSVYFKPQSALVQVQVYGRTTSNPAFVEEHTRLRTRLEWDFPLNKELLQVSTTAIDPEQPPEPPSEKTEQAITPFDLLPANDRKRIEIVRRILHRKKGKLGKKYKETCKSEQIDTSTFRRWRKKYEAYL
jgi:hypothetical protein